MAVPPAAVASQTIEYAKLAVELAWPILIGIVLVVMRRPLTSLAKALTLRVSEGAGFKTPWLEIETVRVSREQGIKPPDGITAEKDAAGLLEKSLQQFDEKAHLVFLAHQLFSSSANKDILDVLLYPVPLPQNDWLRGVDSVGYYFGFNDSDDVFVSRNFGSKFAVAVSAFEPFTCSATVKFKDGREAQIHRFVDFETSTRGRG